MSPAALTSGLTRAAMVLCALALLAACGKKSSPVPPGPADEIVYPRQYPSR